MLLYIHDSYCQSELLLTVILWINGDMFGVYAEEINFFDIFLSLPTARMNLYFSFQN